MTMKVDDLVKALKGGKRVRRSSNAEGSYYYTDTVGRKQYLYRSRITCEQTRVEEPAVMYFDDLTATNWNVVRA